MGAFPERMRDSKHGAACCGAVTDSMTGMPSQLSQDGVMRVLRFWKPALILGWCFAVTLFTANLIYFGETNGAHGKCVAF